MKYPLLTLAAAVTALLPALASAAQTIVDEWPNVKAPPAPALKPVTIDPKTTALLMLDFVAPNCNPRPRCVASMDYGYNLVASAPYHAVGDFVIVDDVGDVAKAISSSAAVGELVELHYHLHLMALLDALGDVRSAGTELVIQGQILDQADRAFGVAFSVGKCRHRNQPDQHGPQG